jgi:hypothetical protein
MPWDILSPATLPPNSLLSDRGTPLGVPRALWALCRCPRACLARGRPCGTPYRCTSHRYVVPHRALAGSLLPAVLLSPLARQLEPAEFVARRGPRAPSRACCSMQQLGPLKVLKLAFQSASIRTVACVRFGLTFCKVSALPAAAPRPRARSAANLPFSSCGCAPELHEARRPGRNPHTARQVGLFASLSCCMPVACSPHLQALTHIFFAGFCICFTHYAREYEFQKETYLVKLFSSKILAPACSCCSGGVSLCCVLTQHAGDILLVSFSALGACRLQYITCMHMHIS